MRNKYSGAAIGGTGPISTTLLPPGDDPPSGPSVNSQTLPAASAASPVGPAAACACASVGKLSIRQNSVPGGNRSIFLSAIDLISKLCAHAADNDIDSPDIANAHIIIIVDDTARMELSARRFTSATLKLNGS